MKRNREIDESRLRIVINKKRLIISCLYAFVSLACFTAYGWTPAEFKYPRQFMVFFGFLFLIIFLISLKKLISREMKMELYRRIGSAIFGFLAKFAKIKRKIKQALGIKERERLYSDDEKRIIIKDNLPKRRNSKSLTKRKFSSLTNQKERIRFIYAKFIIAKRKEGIDCNSFHTPEELRPRTACSETEHKLFELYTPSRFSREFEPTEEEIKKQYDYFSHRIKLK